MMLPLRARPLAVDDIVDEDVALGGDDDDAIVIAGGAFDLRPVFVVTVDMTDCGSGRKEAFK